MKDGVQDNVLLNYLNWFQEAAPFAPDEAVLAQLVDMGFSRNGCTRALFETKNSGVEAAMNWVMEHMGDANFNDPFTDPK